MKNYNFKPIFGKKSKLSSTFAVKDLEHCCPHPYCCGRPNAVLPLAYGLDQWYIRVNSASMEQF